MNSESPKRPYRQGLRAAAAEMTGERILEAFRRALAERWFEEIRLDDVAREAKVTVQTVIRRFGGKEGLLAAAAERVGAEVRQRRRAPHGDLAAAVAALALDYEASGDFVLRLLAQEERYPPIRVIADIGRKGHREWLESSFAGVLDAARPALRRRRLDALVAATDVYVWKLYRRDMKRSVAAYREAVEALAAAALIWTPFNKGNEE
ncbi:MAG TPA: helix-turn-helix domain-containing protein [Allosphingosinicella sp.]|jgi:AcrR family transcriptional regulator